jgi:hypothetical protein
MKKTKEKERFSGKMADYLVESLKLLTNSDLHDIIVQCSLLKASNCWWVEYRLRDIIKEVVTNELELREITDTLE